MLKGSITGFTTACFILQSALVPTLALGQSAPTRSPAGISADAAVAVTSPEACVASVCSKIEAIIQDTKQVATLGALLAKIKPHLGAAGERLERRARSHRGSALKIEPTGVAAWTYTASGQIFRVAILATDQGFAYTINDKLFQLNEGDTLKTIEKQIASVMPTSLSSTHDRAPLVALLVPEAKAFWMLALGLIGLIGGGWLLWNEAKKQGSREERRRQSAEQ